MKIFLAALAVFTLAGNAVLAGSLAPAPRIVSKYERNFIENSGAQTLEELLDTGIIRYFLTGGQPLLVLVNGRPYATTSSNLDTLPLSAVERIELLASDGLASLGGAAVRGALNIVLRSDLNGFETRTIARMPSQDGGDGWQGSVFWGGGAGKGRLIFGADVIDRQEITSRSREYSRSVWPSEDGAFRDTKNVSVGGNTIWVDQRKSVTNGEIRTVALGECETEKGYTGRLLNPPGGQAGDEGCGFAYGNIAWNTESYEQRSLVLNLDHPLGEQTDLHLDANFSQGESAFRYAPSIDSFSFTPTTALLNKIISEAGTRFTPTSSDEFAVAHRFVAHGNRDWFTDSEEYDVSVSLKGRLAEDLGYDARVSAFRQDSFVSGGTFVHGPDIVTEIEAGNYNLVDPFDDSTAHLQAIKDTSLRLERDSGSEYLEARLALEGSGFAIGGRNSAWTAGFELDTVKAHDLSKYRDNDGEFHDVSDVLGSGGASYAGRRKTVAAFAEMSVPLDEDLDLRIAGRGDEYDDLGGLESRGLAVEYRPNGAVTIRGSWSAGDTTPSMLYLHSSEVQDHPYVGCDPGTGDPPRTCTELNARQVTRVTTGNPRLEPPEAEKLTVGAEARRGPFFLGVEWYRLSRSDLPGQNSAHWAILNLDECEQPGQSNCIERIGGEITIHDSYASIVDSELSGLTTRFGGGVRTSWGVAGVRGAWRRITSAELRVAGRKTRYAISRNMVRIGFLARRGGLSAIWTANYRASYKNQAGTGEFKSWTGHDAVLNWTNPLGLEGARITTGVFNLTDTGLTVNTANPSSVDGPTAAGWGRTFFLTLNMRF